MSLAGVDLNLLVALDALLAERSVTRAADRLGLSQPGMSNTNEPAGQHPAECPDQRPLPARHA